MFVLDRVERRRGRERRTGKEKDLIAVKDWHPTVLASCVSPVTSQGGEDIEGRVELWALGGLVVTFYTLVIAACTAMMLRRCPEHPEIASAVEDRLWWVPDQGIGMQPAAMRSMRTRVPSPRAGRRIQNIPE